MKNRLGFVSNSSSSSFIIATKGDGVNLKNKVSKVMGVDTSHPLYNVVDDIIDCFVDSTERVTIKEAVEDGMYDIDDMVNKGFTTFYYGSASNEGDAVEAMVCDIGFNYEDEEILILKDGGY